MFANSIGGVFFVLGMILLFPLSLILLLLVLLKVIRLRNVNAINIISGISVFGISVGTAALILVLSVFNGFEELISGLFGAFNPDVKITPARGKTFIPDDTLLLQLSEVDGVLKVSKSLEEVAFFEYKGSRDFGIIKGVDEVYSQVTRIDSTIREGKMEFKKGDRQQAVLGIGMRNKLSVNIDDEFTPVTVYMAKKSRSNVKPFKKRFVYPVGTFVIQQDFDNQYILCSLGFVQRLLDAKGQISALEVSFQPDADQAATLTAIRKLMGSDFIVKDRYQQDEAFLKLMNLEKWMSFAILSLTLVLVAFNMIGSLWMIVLDKKKDIAILKSMGTTNRSIRNIFINQGLLLSLLGMVIGFTVATVLYFSQKYFGIVPIPEGFVVNAYPISMQLPDFFAVTLTVLVIGFLASLPPALRAARVSALIREE